jgi:hypothetical protein
MERDEKEVWNGQSNEAARPGIDENVPDPTDITPESVGPKTATSDTSTTRAAPADDYLTGLKLGAVLAAVTMGAFLMILDLSVVVTVGYAQRFEALLTFILFSVQAHRLTDEFAGYSEHNYTLSLNGRYWLVWISVSPSQVSISLFGRPHAIGEETHTCIDYP